MNHQNDMKDWIEIEISKEEALKFYDYLSYPLYGIRDDESESLINDKSEIDDFDRFALEKLDNINNKREESNIDLIEQQFNTLFPFIEEVEKPTNIHYEYHGVVVLDNLYSNIKQLNNKDKEKFVNAILYNYSNYDHHMKPRVCSGAGYKLPTIPGLVNRINTKFAWDASDNSHFIAINIKDKNRKIAYPIYFSRKLRISINFSTIAMKDSSDIKCSIEYKINDVDIYTPFF